MQYFPDKHFADARKFADGYFQRLAAAAATVDSHALDRAAGLLEECARRGNMIYSCGNGGSAAIANHLVCDCMKGVRTTSLLHPRVHSLSATVETITAVGNDLGYEEIFAYQLRCLAKPGDVLVAISSSGDSPNIINALNEARKMDVGTIAMTGFSGGRGCALADVSLHVDGQNYGIVEDVHQSLMHILAQYLRHKNLEDGLTLGQMKF